MSGLDETLLPTAWTQRMITGVKSAGRGVQVGHGLFVFAEGQEFGHGGVNIGYNASIAGTVDGRFAVAVVTNSDPGGITLAEEITDTIATPWVGADDQPAASDTRCRQPHEDGLSCPGRRVWGSGGHERMWLEAGPWELRGVDASGRSNFLALYDDAAPQVYRYLFRMCAGNAALAEDLTQETFLTALGRFEDGRGGDVSVPWLMVVARNKVLEHHRRVGREDRRLKLVFSRDAERPSTAERTVSQAEAIALLRQLPHDQRIALALRYVEDLEVA